MVTATRPVVTPWTLKSTGLNRVSSALGQHKGEIPTKYSQEERMTQKFFWQDTKNRATLAKDLVQHKTFITALT